MDPVILGSARRHGITDRAILHAYRNPMRRFDVEDLEMLIGPDDTGRFLEIAVASAEGFEFVVHAMPARRKFLA